MRGACRVRVVSSLQSGRAFVDASFSPSGPTTHPRLSSRHLSSSHVKTKVVHSLSFVGNRRAAPCAPSRIASGYQTESSDFELQFYPGSSPSLNSTSVVSPGLMPFRLARAPFRFSFGASPDITPPIGGRWTLQCAVFVIQLCASRRPYEALAVALLITNPSAHGRLIFFHSSAFPRFGTRKRWLASSRQVLSRAFRPILLLNSIPPAWLCSLAAGPSLGLNA